MAEEERATKASPAQEDPTEQKIERKIKGVRRLSYLVVGFTLLAIGLVMLPAPGPGAPIVVAALSILAAAEILWAKRLLKRLKSKAIELKDMLTSKKPPTA